MISRYSQLFLILCLIFLCTGYRNAFSYKIHSDSTQPASNQPSIIKKGMQIQTGSGRTSEFPSTSTQSSDNLVNKDTLRVNASDSLKVKKTNGIDSTVSYSARDSVVFYVRRKKMNLTGQANITLKAQKLAAETIEIDFNSSQVDAKSGKDTSGKFYGFPKFTDKSEEFIGQRILFNLSTQKGTITMGETKAMENGFYYGAKVKKASENTLYIEDGCYTTCTKAHPHFYFGSPKMKVIANDRVFLDPLILYVEDIPVFMLPFGLYFPSRGGRSSGVLFNPPYFSTVDGVVFQNLGYYFALSDYYDTQITADYFSKTGFLFRNSWRYSILNKLNGNISIEFGRRRTNAEQDYTTNWRIIGAHNQTLTPQSRINASFNVATQTFNNRFATDLNQRLQQSLFSNAGYSVNFDNGTSFGTDISATQNIVTKEYTINPNATYTVPTFFPVKKLVSGNSWLRDIGISYSARGSFTQNHRRTLQKIDSLRTDTLFTDSHTAVIRHTPSISISPKFGFFSVTPSINYRENWYFRTITKRMNQADSQLVEEEINHISPQREYSYDFSLGISTRLFGIIKPKIYGINALRHTFTPTLSYSYIPEFSSRNTGYISSYFDYKRNTQTEYSVYERDGGRASSKRAQTISYNLSNRFEAKIAQSDTADKNLDILQLDIQGNYNFELDSLRWSTINTSFRTISLGAFNFNGTAAFTLYDDALNSFGNRVLINKFLYESGSLLRLTNFSVNISTTLGNDNSNQPMVNDTMQKKTPEAGERFSRRINAQETDFDYFGDQGTGYSGINLPWSISGSITYSYDEPVRGFINRRFDLRATASLALTPTWNIRSSINYDFINNNLIAPSIDISKVMDCWKLSVSWFPTGFNQGFLLRFEALASQLRDLAITKRSLPAYR
jgi:lipopolysaccharide assembly outer membrane protein LptD (OstA)